MGRDCRCGHDPGRNQIGHSLATTVYSGPPLHPRGPHNGPEQTKDRHLNSSAVLLPALRPLRPLTPPPSPISPPIHLPSSGIRTLIYLRQPISKYPDLVRNGWESPDGVREMGMGWGGDRSIHPHPELISPNSSGTLLLLHLAVKPAAAPFRFHSPWTFFLLARKPLRGCGPLGSVNRSPDWLNRGLFPSLRPVQYLNPFHELLYSGIR